MTDAEFKNSELTEENVLLLYQECLKTAATEKSIPIKIYQPELCGKDSPTVEFDVPKIIENIPKIHHLLGQLAAVHQRQIFMSAGEGFWNYKGQRWTENNSTLFALYYLGVASTMITPFIKAKQMALSITKIDAVTPSYPKSDPNYKRPQ